MKQIPECTDGRGCKGLPIQSGNCQKLKANYYLKGNIDDLMGCDAYQEKPPEPTLKERIEVLVCKYEHMIIDKHHVQVDGKREEVKALLRDIVDYTLKRKIPNDMEVLGKYRLDRNELYKELNIEE